jgi:hypothetical protein
MSCNEGIVQTSMSCSEGIGHTSVGFSEGKHVFTRRK